MPSYVESSKFRDKNKNARIVTFAQVGVTEARHLTPATAPATSYRVWSDEVGRRAQFEFGYCVVSHDLLGIYCCSSGT